MNTKTSIAFAVRAFLLAALIAGSAAPVLAASVTIRVPALEAQAGGTLELPVEVVGNPGLGAIHVEITYDTSALKAEEVVAGPILKSALFDFDVKKPGRVRTGFCTSGGVKGDGAIFLVRFTVLEQAAGKSPVGLEKCRAWDDSDQELELLVKTVAGELTIGTGAGSGGSSWILLVAGAVGLVLVGVFVAVLIRRGRRSPAAQTPPRAVPARANPGVAAPRGNPPPAPAAASGSAPRVAHPPAAGAPRPASGRRPRSAASDAARSVTPRETPVHARPAPAGGPPIQAACPKCHAPLPDDEELRFCPKCGKPLEEAPPKCAKCGKALKPDDKFCGGCGTPRA
ncbi:MAG: zinc ribbon domain-containing protein [Planctomycetes bacterium]|nr:zinc ribbon domain-containing protein [Planctomycetota bacterium]